MARTYVYQDVIDLVSRQVPRIVESDAATFISNMAMAEIYKRYDFRETLGVLPPFFLVPNTQDYGSPAVVVPTDFLGIRKAYLVRLNTTPVYRQSLQPIKDLELTTVRGIPGAIGYEPATASLRLFPCAPENLGAPDWIVTGEYKKRPTKVTPGTLSSALLPFDDMYLLTMSEVFKWIAWTVAGDPRAQPQLLLAERAMVEMASNESLELGDVVLAPAEPLAVTSKTTGFLNSWGLIYGY